MEIRWSEWLESMRKDVECTFGILKGRWRILKSGVCLHGVREADKIWETCCALHNWLLEHDGLDKHWTEGVALDYEGDMGLRDPEDVDPTETVVSMPIRCLLNPSARRKYDTSAMGVGIDGYAEDDTDDDPEDVQQTVGRVAAVAEDGVTVVRHLSRTQFIDRLVVHFDIAFKKNEIMWPKRNRVEERNM